jgi:hypothetical protein
LFTIDECVATIAAAPVPLADQKPIPFPIARAPGPGAYPSTIVVRGGVSYGDFRIGARARGSDIDAASSKPEYRSILDIQCGSTLKQDAVDARSDSVDPHIAYGHDIIGARRNHGPVRARDQNRSNLTTAAIESNGLCDSDSDAPKATRIRRIDLAVRRGFRDRSRNGLARSRATAWIGVVPYARNPRACCLGARRCSPNTKNAADIASNASLVLRIMPSRTHSQFRPLASYNARKVKSTFG